MSFEGPRIICACRLVRLLVLFTFQICGAAFHRPEHLSSSAFILIQDEDEAHLKHLPGLSGIEWDNSTAPKLTRGIGSHSRPGGTIS